MRTRDNSTLSVCLLATSLLVSFHVYHMTNYTYLPVLR